MKTKFAAVISNKDNVFWGKFAKAILLSSSQLLSLLFNFISILIIARECSLESFGILTLCLTIYNILSIFSELGFYSTIGTSLSKGKFRDSDLFGFTVITSFCLSIIFLISLCIIYPFMSLFYQQNLLSCLINSGLLSFSFLLIYALPFVFSGSEKIKTFSLFNFLNNFSYLIFVLIQSYFFKNNNISLYINLKSISIFISILFVILILKPTFLQQKNILKQISIDWKNFGFHCFISRLYNSTIPYFIILAVGYVLSEKSAAVFRISFNFMNPLLMVFLSFTQTMAKKISNMSSVPNSVFFSNMLLSFFMVIFSAISCYFLIEYFLGEKYKESYPLFLIMLICCFLYGNYRIYYEWLVLNGHGKKVMNATRFAFFFILFTFYPLLKYFGVYGAPFALVGSYSICTFFVIIYYRSTIKENAYASKKQELYNSSID